MSKLHELKIKKYAKIEEKHPNVDYVYKKYKYNNLSFHQNHKFTSWKFLSKLISADKLGLDLTKVPFPKGTYNPFLSNTCKGQIKVFDTDNCFALPDNQLMPRKAPSELAHELEKFDVISFDVFDTCIFRPFANPTDVFYLLECQNSIINFGDYRRSAEFSARQNTTKPNFEVDIYDIYAELEKICYLKKKDAEKEIELEKQVCYANPYMLEVFNLLKKKRKKLIAISDMYLPSKVIKEILEKNGFKGFDKVFVSCEQGYCKSSGVLFDIAKKSYPNANTFAHVGDNEEADIKGAQKAGLVGFYYENCNNYGNTLRPQKLCSPVGSMYKGVVNNYLYNGTNFDNARECFGFLYAGPIVVGYLEWINEFVKNHNLDKIWFLARDMDIFYKMYNKFYKKYDNEYVATSRFSLQECLYEDFTDEIFFHTILPRSDRGYTIEQAFNELNLSFLFDKLSTYKLNKHSFILGSNTNKIKNLIFDNIDLVVKNFKNNEEAAKLYFKQKLGGARKLCVVDLGWRGSILAYLEYLLVKKWKLCDEVKGVLIGSAKSPASVNLISRGIVTPYAFDHNHNRDFMKDNWNEELPRVLILESLFTSEENSLVEYRLNKAKNDVEFLTYEDNPNNKIIKQFHTGIENYITEFEKHHSKFKKYLPMSAVDAFEPMNAILNSSEYIAKIIGDVLDTPYQVAGINIPVKKYVPLGQILLEKGIIKKWPL